MARPTARKPKWQKIISWITLLSFTLQPSFAAAQIAADTNAAAHNRPAIEQAANGTTVVQIATPSAAGISRNLYQQFDIDKKGLILNNAFGMSKTELAGYIMGNSNLKNGSARIILNEVTGTNISQLQGYLEIAGQKADVIIANPNGIMGNGFGFINTGHAVLTTGVPIFGGSGSLEAFRVTNGTIAIEGNGIDATRTEKVDLISRALTVNAGIWAKDLNVVTGANEVNAAALTANPLQEEQQKPQVAIDVSSLGGMYAGKIKLVGTEKGVGVNSKGTLSASSGNLSLNNEGEISLSGTVSTAGDLQIASKETVINKGTIYAKQNANLQAANQIENQATIAAGNTLELTANQIHSNGTLAAGIQQDGTWGQNGNLQLNAKDNIQTTGKVLAKTNLQITANQLNLQDTTLYGNQALHLKALDGDINSQNSQIGSEGNVQITATGAINNQNGKISADDTLTLQAQSIENQAGTLKSNGSLELSAKDTLKNQTGQIEANQTKIIAKTLDNQQGRIANLAETELKLEIASELDNTNGNIGSNGTIDLKTGNLQNNNGQLIAKDTITMQVEDTIDNTKGKIVSNSNLNLTAEKIKNQNQGNIVAKQNATLNIGKDLQNDTGIILAEQDLNMIQQTGTITNNQGIVQAGNNLTVQAENADIAGGEFSANGAVTVKANNLIADKLIAGKDLTMKVEQDLTINQLAQATKNLTVNANGKITNAGNMIALEGMQLHSKSLENAADAAMKSGEKLNLQQNEIKNQGTIFSKDDLTIEAQEQLTSTGTIAGEKDVDLTGRNITSTGTLIAGIKTDGNLGDSGNITISAEKTLTATGRNIAGKHLTMQGDTVILAGAESYAGQNAEITARTGDIDNSKGNLSAGDTITLNAKNTLINGQAVTKANKLQLNANNIQNQSGILLQYGQSDLAIHTETLDNTNGQIATNSENLSIEVKKLDNSKGQIQHAGNGIFTLAADKTLNNTKGKIVGNQALKLKSETIENTQGTISAKDQLNVQADELGNKAGTIVSNETADLKTKTLDNIGGKLFSQKDLQITSEDTLNNTRGEMAAGQNLTLELETADFINDKGTAEAGQNFEMQAKSLQGTQGKIAAQENVVIDANNVTDAGSISTGKNLTLKVAGDFTNGKDSSWKIANDINLNAGGTLTNAGTIESGGNLTLYGQNVENTAGATLTTNQTLNVTANEEAKNSGSFFGKDITVTADKITNESETAAIAATNSVNLYAKDAITNSDGALIYSMGNIDIAGSEEKNADGSYAKRAKTLTNSSANIEADQDIAIYADDVVNKKSVFEIEKREVSSKDYIDGKRDIQYSPFKNISNSVYMSEPEYQKLVLSKRILSKELNEERLEAGLECFGFGDMLAFGLEVAFGNYEPMQYTLLAGEKTQDIIITKDSQQGKIIAKRNIVLQSKEIKNHSSQIMAGESLLSSGDVENKGFTSGREKVRHIIVVDGALFPFPGMQKYPSTLDVIYAEGLPFFFGEITSSIDEVMETESTGQSSNAIFGGGREVELQAINIKNITTSSPTGVGEKIESISKEHAAAGVKNDNDVPDLHDTKIIRVETNAGTAADPLIIPAIVPSENSNVNIPWQTDNGGVITLPQNALYTIKTEPTAHYLIETNPKFTNQKSFTSSDILLEKIKFNPATTMKRLGDGFYEQKLIQDQITNLTGRVYLGDYENSNEQYRTLLQNAATTAENLDLILGIALTPEQQKALTTDIVWLVEKEVEGQKVLVPVLYLSALRKGDLQASGAIINADNVKIKVDGDVINSGTIQALATTQIDAENITNVGGNISGNFVEINADENISNLSGRINGQDISLSAGENITSRTYEDVGITRTALGSTANISAGNTLTAIAEKDLNLFGTKVVAGKDVYLKADDINLGVATTVEKWNPYATVEDVKNLGSTIHSDGDIKIIAEKDLIIAAADITAENSLTLSAGKNLELGAVADRNTYNYDGGKYDYSGNNYKHQLTISQQLTNLKAGQDIDLSAKEDLKLTGVQATAQTIQSVAGGNLTLDAVKNSTFDDRKTGSSSNYDRNMRYDEKVIGTNLSAENDLNLKSSTGDLMLKGSIVSSEQGHIDMTAAGNVNIESVTEKHETLKETKRTKKKTFSKKTTLTRDHSITNEVVGSMISGDSVKIDAGNDITVKGSSAVGTNDVNLKAGSGINLETADQTGASEHYSYTKKSGLFSGGGFGFTIGSKSEKSTLKEQILARIGSTIGSIDGNVTLEAGNAIDGQGATLIGGKDISLTGKQITLDNSLDTYDSQYKYEFKQSGLSVSLGGGIIDTALTTANEVKRSGEVQDDRLKTLYAYKAYEDIQKVKDQLAENGGKPSIGVNISIGSTKTSVEQITHIETVNPSNVTAGGNVDIKATEKDINLKGTNITAGEDIKLKAKQDINIEAAQNKQQIDTKTSSSSWSVGGTIGSGAFANFSKGSGKENQNAVTHTGSTIDAKDTLNLESGNDTNITGSKVKGEKVEIKTEGDLNIASLQDTDDYNSSNKNIGGGFGTGKASGTHGSTGKGKTDSTYQSVTDQAGIYAGQKGFDIEVGKNTDLKGAVISSEAEAVKNALTTGTLTFTNLENRAEYTAKSSGVNYNAGRDANGNEIAQKDKGFTPAPSVTANGDASSTTKSAIAPGTIEIRNNSNQDLSGLSRNTEQALNELGKIFDKKKIEEQQELANLFGEIAFKAIGDLGLKEGSPEKIALDSFAGGIMAKLGGGDFASGAAGAGINQLVMNELKNIKDPAIMQWASALVGSIAAKIVGGDAQTGASVAVSETKNNALSHEQQRQKKEEMESAKPEEKDAVKEKWDKISDEQENDPNIEKEGTVVYDKDDKTRIIFGTMPGMTVVAPKVDYGSLFDEMQQWYQGTFAYKIYKQQIAPIGQGMGAAIAENFSLGIVPLDMSANNANPKLYYTTKAITDGVFVIGGTFVTMTSAGGTIVTSPTGVGAVAGTATTTYTAGVTLNSAYNFHNDLDKVFSSGGASTAESINWKGFSNGKLKSHYDKHVVDGNEFGDISQNEYLKKAKEFAAESNPNFQETKVGNFNIKYDPETRRVFIGHEKSREIRTFYKADSRDADPFQAAIELAKELSGK